MSLAGSLSADARARAGDVLGAWRTALAVTYVALVPGQSLTPFATHDEQRVLQVTVLAVLTVSLLARRRDVGEVLRSLGSWRWVGLALAALGTISSLVAVDPMTGWLDVGLLVGLGGLCVAVATDTRLRPTTVLWGVLVGMVVGLAYYAADLATMPGVTERVSRLWARVESGGFAHPRHMNQWQVVLLPTAAAVAAVRWLPRWVGGVVFFVCITTWWMVLVSTGRGAVGALCVSGLLLAAFRGPAGRRVAVRLLGAGLAALPVAWWTHWRPTGGGVTGAIVMGGRNSATTLNGRDVLWRDALDTGLNAPLLGIGPGHLAHLDMLPDAVASQFANHPHNSVLQFFAEWGVPSALLFVAAASFVTLQLTLRGRLLSVDGVTPQLVEGAVGSFLAGMALSLVSGVLVMPVGSTALAVVAGLLLGLHARDVSPAHATSDVGVVAALLVAMVAVAGPAYEVVTATPTARTEELRAFAHGSGSDLVVPRFWIQGFRGVPWEPPPPPTPLGTPRDGPTVADPSELEETS